MKKTMNALRNVIREEVSRLIERRSRGAMAPGGAGWQDMTPEEREQLEEIHGGLRHFDKLLKLAIDRIEARFADLEKEAENPQSGIPQEGMELTREVIEMMKTLDDKLEELKEIEKKWGLGS